MDFLASPIIHHIKNLKNDLNSYRKKTEKLTKDNIHCSFKNKYPKSNTSQESRDRMQLPKSDKGFLQRINNLHQTS